MQRSAQHIPHFTYVEEIDVSELEALRRHLNEREPDRPRLTLLPLLIQALARTVPSFPQINATFDEACGEIQRHRALHVGIATQTPQGLMVPVLRHAQRLDLWQRAGEIRRLADAARTGRARREELAGSTITITSLGALGGVVTTPIINAPEVAIIGVNRIVERPVVRAGSVVVRSTMNLSCSFDHRIVDGHDGARFVQQLRALMEHPATLFLADPAP
jgi:2-oxoisovalerate dehydrogenase E2 component (dihydrolipoyl transacylase)